MVIKGDTRSLDNGSHEPVSHGIRPCLQRHVPATPTTKLVAYRVWLSAFWLQVGLGLGFRVWPAGFKVLDAAFGLGRLTRIAEPWLRFRQAVVP